LKRTFLQQGYLAWLERGHQRLSSRTYHLIGTELDWLAQKFAQTHGAGLEAALWIKSAVGPTQVAHQHQPAALSSNLLDAGKRGTDAPVVGDLAALQGHVEIHAHEHGLAADVDVCKGLGRHGVCLSLMVHRSPVGHAGR